MTKMYEIQNESTKHTVQKKIFVFKYNETQSARENVARFNGLVADCTSVGIVLDNRNVVAKLIHTLPEDCDSLVYIFGCNASGRI